MLKTSLVSAAIALAVWFLFGIVGPFPVFRLAPSVDVVRVDELNAYQSYLGHVQAGTWDQTKPAVSAPQAVRPVVWLGLHGRNFLISAAIAAFGAVVIVFGLSGIWVQGARTYRHWQETRHYPMNGRVDRQEQRTGEREPAATAPERYR